MHYETLCITMLVPIPIIIYKHTSQMIEIVATPLWAKCEDEIHTLKSGKLESSETPENLELDCSGQNSLH
jgi:hypothetical protein